MRVSDSKRDELHRRGNSRSTQLHVLYGQTLSCGHATTVVKNVIFTPKADHNVAAACA